MRIGRPAPSFALPDQTGTVRTLDELRAGRRAALFFYLNSATPVCVAEVGRFRDAAGEFDRLGVARIGVSMDTAARSAALAAAVSPGFPLLSDVDGGVAETYGVRRGRYSVLPVKRETFVIDTDGTVLHIVVAELRAVAHVEESLAFLRMLAGQAKAR
ncbi:peroxiredoxin [Tsukamurella soli]